MIPMTPGPPMSPTALPYGEVDFSDELGELCAFYWIDLGRGDYIDF